MGTGTGKSFSQSVVGAGDGDDNEDANSSASKYKVGEGFGVTYSTDYEVDMNETDVAGRNTINSPASNVFNFSSHTPPLISLTSPIKD